MILRNYDYQSVNQPLFRIHGIRATASLRFQVVESAAARNMAQSNVLIYVLRHDLRLQDNPVLHHLASIGDHGFTHLLPVYIFPAHQIEVSGFINDGSACPYPDARSTVSNVWRTGPHRAKFITESVWNLKESLESVGSSLVIRVGKPSDIIEDMLEGFSQKELHVGAVWMTGEEGVEERRDQRAISAICEGHGAECKLWEDEKYYVDESVYSVAVARSNLC